MTITLAATWNPRGEYPRLQNLFPALAEVYSDIVFCLPPIVTPEMEMSIRTGFAGKKPVVTVIRSPKWSWGRYLALQKALDTPASHIQYADMDRLVRWVETNQAEWRRMAATIQDYDCLIFGRTETAYLTHPQALIQTEAICNAVISSIIGKPVDASAGSKGFSRGAAQFILDNSQPGRALGTDAEWLILLQRGGFQLEYMAVEGLDWESADHYQAQAADETRQRQAAEAYDADPRHWERRVQIADEIVRAALDASRKSLKCRPVKQPLFDLDQVFETQDYVYFYQDMLTEERTDVEVRWLVQALDLGSPLKILDLACGHGRIANRLARLGHQVTGVDLMPGFLEIARSEAFDKKLVVEYRQGDMRSLDFGPVFDRVLILFTAFGYFEDDENLCVLRNVYTSLKPGGLFLFDIPNRDTFVRDMVPAYVTDKEGNLMIDRGSFDTCTGRWQNRRIIYRDGIRKDKPFSIRLYNPNEIVGLLNQAGLEVVQRYGGLDGQPLSTESKRMVIIARK